MFFIIPGNTKILKDFLEPVPKASEIIMLMYIINGMLNFLPFPM